MKQILLTIFLSLMFSPCLTYAKGLEVMGKIVAFELSYGHNYSIDKTQEVPRKYLVARVDEIIKGDKKSKYILVSFAVNKGEVNFYDKNSWNFKLSKRSSCNTTLRKLQYVFFGSEKVSGIQPRLLRTVGYEDEILPLDSTLPCYDTNLKKMEENNLSTPVSKGSEKESYVLEVSLWLNLPEFPMTIFFGGIDEFTNKTNKTISEFNLGCVTNENNQIQLKQIFEVKKIKISPSKESFEVNNASLAPSMDKLYICYQMKAKLTAVRVKFEDNSIWELK